MPIRLRPVLMAAVVALAAVAAAPANAAPQVSGVFDLPGVATNSQLTVGPDGDVWVALDQAVGRVSPAGSVTVLQAGDLGGTIGFPAGGITSADGFIWVSQTPGAGKEALVKIPPANPGAAAGVPGTGIAAGSTAVTTGPDGNVWVATAGKITKVPPGNPATATSYPVTGLAPKALATSGDGTLWVTDTGNGGRLLNVTTTGSVTSYAAGGTQPQFLAASPTGQVVYGLPNNSPQQIARLVPGGLPLLTDRPSGSDPFGVTYGADGAFWVAEFAGNRLARVTPDGTLTTLGGLPVVAGQGPRQLTAAGTTLWVTLDKPGDSALSKIARVVGVDPPAPVQPTPPPGPSLPAGGDVTPPVVSLTLSRARFRPAAGSTAIGAATRRTAAGTTLSVQLSERAAVRLPVARALAGRRVGGRCVKPTTRNRRAAARCARWTTVRTLTRTLPAGTTKVAFTARFAGRALPAGAYRIAATATDTAGLRGTAAPVRFTIVRR